jgi:hypothetical protein
MKHPLIIILYIFIVSYIVGYIINLILNKIILNIILNCLLGIFSVIFTWLLLAAVAATLSIIVIKLKKMTEKEQSEIMLLCGVIHSIIKDPKCCDAIKALQIVEIRLEKIITEQN